MFSELSLVPYYQRKPHPVALLKAVRQIYFRAILTGTGTKQVTLQWEGDWLSSQHSWRMEIKSSRAGIWMENPGWILFVGGIWREVFGCFKQRWIDFSRSLEG